MKKKQKENLSNRGMEIVFVAIVVGILAKGWHPFGYTTAAWWLVNVVVGLIGVVLFVLSFSKESQ